MKTDAGYLSVDFLAGFAIFMIAFIWVATMIPGLLAGVSGTAIDFDAVAYRTGVILAEDPGWASDETTNWEKVPDNRVDTDVIRIGYAISKDSPNILSSVKMNQSFCQTAFVYPGSYQRKVIFGDHPYSFNISALTNNAFFESVGEVRPAQGYGYIRRVAKVKQMSNATINAVNYRSAGTSDTHHFWVEINLSRLNEESRQEYKIDPTSEPIIINLTNLKNSLIIDTATPIKLTNVVIYSNSSKTPACNFTKTQCWGYFNLTVDGAEIKNQPKLTPKSVTENVSLIYPAGSLYTSELLSISNPYVLTEFTFKLENPNPMMEWAGDYFINTTHPAAPSDSYNDPVGENMDFYNYDYNPLRVTQPWLEPAVVEVAIW